MEAERKVTPAQAEAWCKEHGIDHYFEVSAKENTMVEEAFQIAGEIGLRFREQTKELLFLQ